jgi:hypothetical protein
MQNDVICLPRGINVGMPLTRVVRMSVQTQEIKTKAADIYRTVGNDYIGTIVEPQFRSAIREVKS